MRPKISLPLIGIFLICHNVSSFNLDIVNPHIKLADRSSSFGFSLAGHVRDQDGKGIIVGAPSDVNSGALFFCPHYSARCSRLPINIYKSAPFSYDKLGKELLGYALSTLPLNRSRSAVACSPRLSYEVTGNIFVTGGCFLLDNLLSNAKVLRDSSCLDIPQASRSLDLRYCLNGASTSFFDDNENDLIISGSPYFNFARGIGLVNNQTGQNTVRRIQPNNLGDYSLLGSSTAISDRVYNSGTDRIKLIVSVLGGPGVQQTMTNKGSGFVILNMLEKSSGGVVIPETLRLEGRQFGSRFGHAVQFIDLNGDGWDDLVVSAPFHRIDSSKNNKKVDKGDVDAKVSGIPGLHLEAFGCVYIFWNQRRRLPDTNAFSHNACQVIVAPEILSQLSGFGASLTGLGDIDHDGVDDFAIGAPYDQSGGVVLVYHGSKSGKIGPPTQVIDGRGFSGSPTSFGFSLGLGGMDLDDNGYPDMAIGAPDSAQVVVLLTRPVIKVEVFVVKEDGANFIDQRLDTLEDCTRDTQILPGYWAARVYCLNLRVLVTHHHVDPVPCSQSTIPAKVLLTINPPEHWLAEDFTMFNQSGAPTNSLRENPSASFLRERILKINDPDVTPFYRRTGNLIPLTADETLPFLILDSGVSVCRENHMVGKPLISGELAAATSVRLAFRDASLVDLSSPMRFGVKWILDAPTPPSNTNNLNGFPINNHRENTAEENILFRNECERRDCRPVLEPSFEYTVTKDKDGPVVFVGDDEHQSVQVKATLINRGNDPSYATSLYTSYPAELLDLDTRTRGAEAVPVLVRPGLALCHFGNPLAARNRATCSLTFSVLGQQLMTSSANFTINSTIVSSPKFPPYALRPMTDLLIVKVKMSVNVSLSGEILPNAAYYSGNVTDGILINNGENKIGGTRLLVRIRVQNLRKHSLVPNSRLIIDWPYEIADDVNEQEGKFLFYLLEKPYITKTELTSGSETPIFCDSRALDLLVNPYNYRIFKSLTPKPRGDPVLTGPVDMPDSHPPKYPPLKSSLEITEMPDMGALKRFTTTLSCHNGQLRCVPIVCDLGPLSYRAGAVTLEMPARLWDNTMRQNFKEIFQTSVLLTATWRASVTYAIDLDDKDHASHGASGGMAKALNVNSPDQIEWFELKIFNDMEREPVYPKNMPLYIGLAVFAGLLLLAILIIILWKAKFFERKKFGRRSPKPQPAAGGTTGPNGGDQAQERQALKPVPRNPPAQLPSNVQNYGGRGIGVRSRQNQPPPPISAY